MGRLKKEGLQGPLFQGVTIVTDTEGEKSKTYSQVKKPLFNCYTTVKYL